MSIYPPRALDDENPESWLETGEAAAMGRDLEEGRLESNGEAPEPESRTLCNVAGCWKPALTMSGPYSAKCAEHRAEAVAEANKKRLESRKRAAKKAGVRIKEDATISELGKQAEDAATNKLLREEGQEHELLTAARRVADAQAEYYDAIVTLKTLIELIEVRR